MSSMRNARAVCLFVLTSLMVVGCATSRKITVTGSSAAEATAFVPPSTKVLVIRPKVTYEDTQTEMPLDAETQGASGLEDSLMEKGVEMLKSKLFSDVASMYSVQVSPEQRDLAGKARASASHLIRSRPDRQALQYVLGLGATNETAAVLVQFVRVKIGPAGTWDPNSGAITSAASSAFFRAALLDCRDGRVLWKNSVLLRKVPQPDNSDFEKVVAALYSTLNPQSNENQ